MTSRSIAFLRPARVGLLLACSLCLATGGGLGAAEPDPLDWPNWRGPEQNGISRETGLVDRWDPAGENLLWKRADLGSLSTPIVMRGKLYVLCRYQPGTTKEGEQVVCVDAASGETIWAHPFNVFLSDVPDTRVAWSSVVGDPATGRVYAQGVCGLFLCLDGETGQAVWSRSLSEEFGALTTYGGRTNVPVVFEDLVLISAVTTGWGENARPAHRFLAFDKATGEVVWHKGTRPLPEDTTYSTPVVTVLGGQAAMVFGSGDGLVYAMQPRTGRVIWQFAASRRGINSTPLVDGETVYIGHSEENLVGNTMGAIFAIDALGSGDVSQSGMKWKIDEATLGKSSPLAVGGRLYAVDDAAGLYIVDCQSGQPLGRKQKLGTMMRSSPLYADGKIYAVDLNGRFSVMRPTEKGVEFVHRLRLPDAEECQASPIASHGRLYLNTTGGLYAIGRPGQRPQAEPRPPAPQEAPLVDRQPAQLVVVPAEALVKPGQKLALRVRLFNARGQLLSETSKPAFELSGPGEVDAAGNFTAASLPGHAAALVTARLGDATGTARIRIVPELPWKFDFSDGEVPITWVGARYRHVVLDDELLAGLRSAAPLAAPLYIQAMTELVNSGAKQVVFNDASPRKTWTVLLRYLGLIDEVTGLEEARARLEPGLEALRREEVLASWQWGQDAAGGPQLTIVRGPRSVDGQAVLTKITTIPKGTRSQSWMGPTDLSDYTIQADVCGSIRDEKLPDMGLIAQRYTLDLMGASQQLQIRSWTAQLEARFAKSAPYPWQPETWYTLKFRAAVEDGQAVLRGKVWPRGQSEPEGWLIEAVDATPNLTGSPGLFGNAGNAEVRYDNLSVVPNS